MDVDAGWYGVGDCRTFLFVCRCGCGFPSSDGYPPSPLPTRDGDGMGWDRTGRSDKKPNFKKPWVRKALLLLLLLAVLEDVVGGGGGGGGELNRTKIRRRKEKELRSVGRSVSRGVKRKRK